MEGVTAGEIRQWIDGRWVGEEADGIAPSGISTDTRRLKQGEAFLALRGPNFDGNRFVEEAFDRGACAVIADSCEDPGDRPVLRVADTLKALGEIAKQYRRRFEIPVIAITGSSGKTTAKEMTAAVLGRTMRVLKTPESENNEVGVPLTLLRLTSEVEAVVVELAARKAGDIRYLCEIAQPTIGILLNIGTAHLEFFETVEGVAKAKGELLDYIGDKSSLALVNVDDCVVAREVMRKKGRLLGFSLDSESHFCGEGLVLDQEGRGHLSLQNIRIDLRIPGKHNVYNALAAAAVGDLCAVPAPEIGRALAEFEPASMRSEVVWRNGTCLIKDCYNSNPGSAKAALDLLGDMQLANGGRKIAALGDMLELGDSAPELHAEIGRQTRKAGVELLLTCGPLSRSTHIGAVEAGLGDARHMENKAELTVQLCAEVRPGDVVLVKASRGAAFEEVVERLLVSLQAGSL